MKFTKDQQAESIEYLRNILKPGMTVRTALHSVSRSGMSRNISLHVAIDGEIHNVTRHAARAAGFTLDSKTNDWQIKVGGAGMDMGFALVYGLSRTLYPEGHKCTGSKGYTSTGSRTKAPRCPSNDHNNDYGFLSRQYDEEHAEHKEIAERSSGATQAMVEAYVSARQTWIRNEDPKLWSKRRVHSDGGYAISQSWL